MSDLPRDHEVAKAEQELDIAERQILKQEGTLSQQEAQISRLAQDPDIEADVEDAKRIAHIKALEKLIGNTTDNTALDKYQWALDGLKANYINIDIRNFEKYAGNYGNIKITNQEGKLFCQYKGRPAKLLIPISENYFIVEGVDYYRIKFYSVENKEMLKQIFSYGTIREMFKID